MRGVAKFLLTLVLGVALIWLGFWWYAESRLQSGFQQWAQQQAAAGGRVSYNTIRRGTSPLAAVITVQDFGWTMPPARGLVLGVAAPSLGLRIDALNPLVFHLDLPHTLNVNSSSGLSGVINFTSAAAAADMDPNALFDRNRYPFRGEDFTAAGIDVLASAGSLLVLHIDGIASHSRFNPAAGANATAFSDQTALDGAAISPLLARLASIPFGGRLAHLDVSLTASGPVPPNLAGLRAQLQAAHDDPAAARKALVPVIRQWAAQGGNAHAGADLALGPSAAHASGALKFDANLQPAGTADITADHLDQLSSALIDAYPSLQAPIAQLEARFSPYLSSSAQSGQALAMRIDYGRQAVVINGKQVGQMPPLDWNAVENPPPPAAPGPPTGTEP